jgi:L-cysteine desulfidase
VPIALWGESQGHPKSSIEEALALACIMTSAVTHELGTLSAVCGAANAAGIGIEGVGE